jgi:hypothetical protein
MAAPLRSRRTRAPAARRRVYLCLEQLEVRSLPSATVGVVGPVATTAALAPGSVATTAAVRSLLPGFAGTIPGGIGAGAAAQSFVASLFEALSGATGMVGLPVPVVTANPPSIMPPAVGMMNAARGAFPVLFTPGAGVSLPNPVRAATDNAEMNGGGTNAIEDTANKDDSQSDESQTRVASTSDVVASLALSDSRFVW